MNQLRRTKRGSYSLPLGPVLLAGSVTAALFFGLILSGPLDFLVLRRYCLGHPVAVASVSLFYVGLAGLLWKWYQASSQTKLTNRSAAALRRLVSDGEDIQPAKRVEWLAASWQAQPKAVQESWFGGRIAHTIELQVSRGRRQQLESDLKWLSELDADRQHDSYSLLRIINWAMPMLGFLGTVLGISQTLGQLDTQMLATQQQEAMNQLTAGLYVAFDTTAIALILTVVSMFLQFGISRIEVTLLSQIDFDANEGLVRYLAADPLDSQATLLGPVREMAAELVTTVRSLVEEQAAIWSRSIQQSQREWSTWTSSAADTVEHSLAEGIGEVLKDHVEELQKLHDEGGRQVETRFQQWQTTLSDQARQLQSQQKEMIRQSDALSRLVDSVADLRKTEDSISDGVSRLENVGRIEEATHCMTEAVAVLAASLERAGIFRSGPIRPRIVGRNSDPLDRHDSSGDRSGQENQAKSAETADQAINSNATPLPNDSSNIIPIDRQQRKAA